MADLLAVVFVCVLGVCLLFCVCVYVVGYFALTVGVCLNCGFTNLRLFGLCLVGFACCLVCGMLCRLWFGY